MQGIPRSRLGIQGQGGNGIPRQKANTGLVPGLMTGVGGIQARLPIAPRLGGRWPAITRFASQPMGGIIAKRPPVQSAQALARAGGTNIPPAKRFRTGQGATASSLLVGLNPQSEFDAAGGRHHDTISAARLVAAEKGDLAATLGLKGQFVFTDTNALGDSSGRMVTLRTGRRGRFVGQHSDQAMTRLLSLPLLNYRIRQMDRVPGAFGAKSLTPADVLARYRPEGVVRTDAMESEHPAYRNSDVKEYTVTIDGREPDTGNVWGLVHAHQTVYFIIKRIRGASVPNEYTVGPSDTEGVRVQAPAGPDYQENPLQVVPWTSGANTRPTLDDLAYEDPDTHATVYGTYIRVGYVNFPASDGGVAAKGAVWHDASAIMRMSHVDLTLGVRIGGR